MIIRKFLREYSANSQDPDGEGSLIIYGDDVVAIIVAATFFRYEFESDVNN